MHLGFSCHIVGSDDRLLLTRRALGKATWPGWWTNGCCGHPQVGETLREAVVRRLREELGLVPVRVDLLLADFAYRAVMPDGIVEHELCPVVAASVTEEPSPDPAEVSDVEWVDWTALVQRARHHPETLSPWCVEQVNQLMDSGLPPVEQLVGDRPVPTVALDTAIELPGSPPNTARRRDRPEPSGGTSLAAALAALQIATGGLQPVVENFLDRKTAEVEAIDADIAPIAAEVRALIDAGGKRLRPAFVYWGHRATGADHDDAVFEPAAAMELLHTFALIHDDVMDHSITRRGRPSAFVTLAEQHRAAEGSGDSERFGTSAAMLAGDLAFVWADELFDACTLPTDAVARARQVFATLRSEVIAGQYLDVALTTGQKASEARARQVALLKSARYTVTRPLLLGAALADEPAARRVQPALATYGDAVGLAFQMRDDILSMFGDPALTGKGCLEDLREGKRTVLVHRALRLSGTRDRELLARCLGDADLDEQGAQRCRSVIAGSGALASVERLIAHQHEIALAAIDSLEGPARSALQEMAAAAIQRDV